MHVYFSGIGGTAIGPLALIAHKAGFEVSGSDKQESLYIENLRKHGITDIHIGQTAEQIAQVHARRPIDWLVYTSALPIEQPNAPELVFCREHGIKATKRDELLTYLIKKKQLKLIAIAGTHGKTTTTAMAIWLLKQLQLPVSYSVGAKLSFGEMGEFDADSEYFVYEADEFDRNFLAFDPYVSIITGIDWDHPDIYPTRESYNNAFHEFLGKSRHSILWSSDAERLTVSPSSKLTILSDTPPHMELLHLPGLVNRQNAYLVATALQPLCDKSLADLLEQLNDFPGVSRRFEQIAPHVYSDYAHTPPKIRGALQLAHELAGERVVVVYEGLHNTRQHFIKDELKHLFDDVKELYIVPTYLAREDPDLPLLQPADLKSLLSPTAQRHTHTANLDARLAAAITQHAQAGDTVLCITAGGGKSLDEWLRREYED